MEELELLKEAQSLVGVKVNWHYITPRSKKRVDMSTPIQKITSEKHYLIFYVSGNLPDELRGFPISYFMEGKVNSEDEKFKAFLEKYGEEAYNNYKKEVKSEAEIWEEKHYIIYKKACDLRDEGLEYLGKKNYLRARLDLEKAIDLFMKLETYRDSVQNKRDCLEVYRKAEITEVREDIEDSMATVNTKKFEKGIEQLQYFIRINRGNWNGTWNEYNLPDLIKDYKAKFTVIKREAKKTSKTETQKQC